MSMIDILLGERAWFQRIAGFNEIALQRLGRMFACRNTAPDSSDSSYIRIPKPPRTEPGKNHLHYFQRTTASGDCRSFDAQTGYSPSLEKHRPSEASMRK